MSNVSSMMLNEVTSFAADAFAVCGAELIMLTLSCVVYIVFNGGFVMEPKIEEIKSEVKSDKIFTKTVRKQVPKSPRTSQSVSREVFYNEKLNALVCARDRKSIWVTISEMEEENVRPNAVTCSILVKSLTHSSSQNDIRRVMALVDEVEMDEVLFASVIESCVRLNRLDLLSSKLNEYAAKDGLSGLSAPTFGSMIKAFGKAGDVERIRGLWAEMRGRNIVPTSITLGCMVDALVTNELVQEAFELVQEMRSDDTCANLVNTVVYSTLIKGFGRLQQPDRAQQVFDEMRSTNIACNTVTYNTMINVNVRIGRMSNADELFQVMVEDGVKPDVITYSTLVKGYCHAGDIDAGFKVLREMTAGGQEPDEIMYNSLLDGCAKQYRVDDALQLLEDMIARNVQPSNFTLSILVKLLGRSRRLGQAFTMVEETCARYGFKANIHVYTCLMQACIQNRQLPRAFQLFTTIVDSGVVPDARTFSVLARGCTEHGSFEKAAAVVRCAYGLATNALPVAPEAAGLEARALEDVMGALSTATAAEKVAVPLLAELSSIGVMVESRVYAQSTYTSMSRAGRCNDRPVRGACRGGR